MLKDSKNIDMEYCAQLWEQYEPKIRKLCNLKLSKHPEEIDEIISETYLALCEAVENHKEFINPPAWLFGAANNLIKQKFKQLKLYREKNKSISDEEYELIYCFDYLDAIVTDEDIENMKDEIEEVLTDSEKALMRFIYKDRLKMKEIAVILNTTEIAVKQRNYRLVKKIKQMARDKDRNFL